MGFLGKAKQDMLFLKLLYLLSIQSLPELFFLLTSHTNMSTAEVEMKFGKRPEL